MLYSIKNSNISGHGTFANNHIHAGTDIGPAFTIVGHTGIADKDIKRTPLGAYTNHSGTPNSRVMKIDNDYHIVSVSDIRSGEEITINYNNFEWSGKRDFAINDTSHTKLYKNDIKSLDHLNGYEFDNRYVCDTAGNVYLVKTNNDTHYIAKKMKPFITSDGYVEYVLAYPTGNKKHIQAHRIVAGLYIPNYDLNKKYVNHKDGNRSNNNVTNLEWMTHSENIKHSFDSLGKVVWNSNKK